MSSPGGGSYAEFVSMSPQSAETADAARRDDGTLVDAAWRQVERLRGASAGGDDSGAGKAPDPGAPLISLPGYRVIEEVQRGGQGVVYAAIQESTRRKVAIKVLRHGPFADRSEMARFEREAELLGRLRHPNIVAVHDRGHVAGHAYYVMDFIPGRPLDAFVADYDGDAERTLRLFQRICEAVNSAHLHG